MKFSIAKEDLQKPLNRVIGAVERKNTLPILGMVLLKLENGSLELVATDTEIELRDSIKVDSDLDFSWTLPARKLSEILRSLPDHAMVNFEFSESKTTISSGKSRFTLSMLPASDFPIAETATEGTRIDLLQSDFKRLLGSVEFSMATHDVRYYLNGLMLELEGDQMIAVTTDGHRLSIASHQLSNPLTDLNQVIIPNKAVRELIRLLDEPDESMSLIIGDSNFYMRSGSLSFASKVIDGKFPDYKRVVPQNANFKALIDRQSFLDALNRVQILSNERFNGVRMQFAAQDLYIQAQNPEQELAEDSVSYEYNGESVEIGFNIRYIIDVLKVISSEQIEFHLSDANASAMIYSSESSAERFVVMPIRL